MINDIIKPMGLDLTKDLHGHVRVETRDRWTGRVVDSQEKDNLITNAVQDMILTCAWTNSALAQTWTPIYSKVLGGLLLFDSALTESANNVDFPSSAKLVAYAGQNANANVTNSGSLNSSESGKTSNGFVSVWDFATSQANGTIASLARTSDMFAAMPVAHGRYNRFWNYTDGGSSYGFYPAGYDKTNHYLYFGLTGDVTENGVTYSQNKIYRVKQVFDKITLTTAMRPAREWTAVKTLSNSDGSTYSANFTYDQYENNFAYRNGTTLHLIAIDGTHTTKTLSGAPTGSSFSVSESYYWAFTFNNATVYRYEKSNVANVKTYSVGMGEASNLSALENDVVVAYKGDSATIFHFIYPDDTTIDVTRTRTDEGSANASLVRRVAQFYAKAQGTNLGSYFYPNSHYLGTIANLDSPVTKTSSQTMKITYTLTEA